MDLYPSTRLIEAQLIAFMVAQLNFLRVEKFHYSCCLTFQFLESSALVTKAMLDHSHNQFCAFHVKSKTNQIIAKCAFSLYLNSKEDVK